MNEVIELFKRKAGNKKVRITTSIPEVNVYGDGHRITQVFTKLIDNAIKFTPKHGSITITSKEHGYIKISVKDTGIGISEVK